MARVHQHIHTYSRAKYQRHQKIIIAFNVMTHRVHRQTLLTIALLLSLERCTDIKCIYVFILKVMLRLIVLDRDEFFFLLHNFTGAKECFFFLREFEFLVLLMLISLFFFLMRIDVFTRI